VESKIAEPYSPERMPLWRQNSTANMKTAVKEDEAILILQQASVGFGQPCSGYPCQ